MKSQHLSNQFRPSSAWVDLSAIQHNFKIAQQCAGAEVKLMPVVKANAYGHGSVPVAQCLQKSGADVLCVATPEEGIQLREAGIHIPILLLAGPYGAKGEVLRHYQLTPCIFNEAQVYFLENSLKAPLVCHLKVDTGMHRLGVLPSELKKMLRLFQDTQKIKKLKLGGVLSHLAQADESLKGPTQEQFDLFTKLEKQIKKSFPHLQHYHLANSAALLTQKLGPCNAARPGIMLYGASPAKKFKKGKELLPVMHFKTEIISLKTIDVGEAVSYGATWQAKRKSRIAVLPVGYADGYRRHLSNRGEVLLHGRRAPVVGRVCMDLTMIDVTDIKKVKLGDSVTLWGPGLPVEGVAKSMGTISYELLCGVSARVPRLYKNEDCVAPLL